MSDMKPFNAFYDRVTQPGMEERWLKEFFLPWCRVQRASLYDFTPVYKAIEAGKHTTFASVLNHVCVVTGQANLNLYPEPMAKDVFGRCIRVLVTITHQREAAAGVGVEDLWAWGLPEQPKGEEDVAEVEIGKPSPNGASEGPSPSAGEDLQP